MFEKFRRRQERVKLKALLSMVNADSQPTQNALRAAIRDLPAVNLNLKTFGYDLARRLADALPIPEKTEARHVGLSTKISVQADIESDWAAHWCNALRIPVVFHRKIWEHAYTLQAMHEAGLLHAGVKALGFGCGQEPIPSYLASLGMSVTATDLFPEQARAAGWVDTGQHAVTIEQAYRPELVEREAFERLVKLRYVDMNAIPDTLNGYDLCWSTCALEHLGSIKNGLDFIENSLRTLRPGGLAVHTSEYNIDPEGATVDNWVTVLFQRRHIEEIASRLAAQGHYVAPLNFDLGGQPMDRFVDLPPWHADLPQAIQDWMGPPHHLKLSFEGFVTTCFGIVVRKAGGEAGW